MKRMTSFALAMGAAALLAACSSTPVAPPPAPAPVDTVALTPAAPAAQPAATTVATVSVPEYLDPKSALSKVRSVFFDFDDFSIKGDYTPLIERHGKFLAGHPAVHVRVEGNTDERGSAEYNLALGQKRAESVVRALKIYGATEAQLEPVSYGEEKPRANGHDEAAWSQNRRADLDYPTK